MRALEQQTLYEILEVPDEATQQEIDRAYRICRATYEPSSVATYTVFSDRESSDILRRIEEAYAVLSDATRRREYDRLLRKEEGSRDVAVMDAPRARTPRPQAPLPRAFDIEEAMAPEGSFDGEALRRYRLSRGVELEEIAAVTKINELVLKQLESNCYTELPPRVYVRGLVKEYARCLNLDPARVADGYLERYDEAH